ncbi:hypothetical protein [Leptospira licerasiae]|uniref:hypothetical protein n=1 Tax=Leptospira licerasiae TaxID=447106 RepID=UPI0030187B9D
MKTVVCLCSILFISCVGSAQRMQQAYSEHPDTNKACLKFLSSEKSASSENEQIMLDTLYKIAEHNIRETYLTGQIVYVPEAGEGRHLLLNRDGKLEYYRIKYETLHAKEGTEFFCAERLRIDLERKFLSTSAKLKRNPLDLKARQELETNLESYLKFANVVQGKSQIIRNFLFFSLGKYLKGDQGLPISPCEFTQKILEPITIATSGLIDADPKLAWAANIQIFTAYELGFTLAGYCK